MFLNRRISNYVFKLTKRYYQQQSNPLKSQPAPFTTVSPVFRNAQNFPERIALRDRIGTYSYGNIFVTANALSEEISRLVQGKTNEKILFMCPNDASYVITLWAIWMSGQIAVPLSPLHPKNILLYYANDSNARLIITTPEYSELMHRVSRNSQILLHVLDDKIKLNCIQTTPQSKSDLEGGLPAEFYDTSNAMILYTSGTTGSPKGVVLSHKNLHFQTTTLLEAWKWNSNDVLLHTLPLHHVHGIVNALLCPLAIGAKTILLKKFNANTVWSYLLGVSALPEDRKITVYMAVPTIYSKLIEEYTRVFKDDPKMVEYIKNTLKNKVRLMVSGSSPLPTPVFNKWLEISGHQLLERYGMTETGMALSNTYDDSIREPGYVGVPLPGVSVRLVETDEENGELTTVLECANNGGNMVFTKKLYKSEDHKGELLVKSEGVFKEYLNRPEATHKEFTSDRWFKTGDLAEYSTEKKKFRMLGRKIVDIIKTGGFKISALDVEATLLAHPDIKECAVVGVEDEKWGQKVAVVLVLADDKELTLKELRDWAEDKLPKYAIPTMLTLVEAVPRNSMGKVNKMELAKVLF